MSTLPPPSLPVVRIATTSGRITVTAEARSDVDVSGDATVGRTGDQITVAATSAKLDVRVPNGTDIVVGTTSGRIDVSGAVGAVSITTESGRVTVAEAATIDVRSTSGAINVEHCGADCCLRSENGSIAVGSCGAVDAATTSGRIALREVHGTARAHCTTGRVDITLAAAHDVDAETVTGRISVSVPAGVNATLVNPGDHLASGRHADCTISASSVTGRVDVVQR